MSHRKHAVPRRVGPLVLMVMTGASLVSSGATGFAGDYNGAARPAIAPNRCASRGPDFAAVEGSDACVQIGGHVRVRIGTNVGLGGDGDWTRGTDWTAARASAATLRSDNADLMPTGSTMHLRVHSGLQYPDPFR